ncbi:MAG TPA: hypothetical protein VEK33_22405 [Terriglobales bacterium]|nr:hypothetical protein [Terriglobales bacterium]
MSLVSPDGKFLLARDAKGQRWLYPIGGGEPQRFDRDIKPDEFIMGFSADGSLEVRARTVPVEVFKVDVASGRREAWKEITPADPAGALMVFRIVFSADGKSYAYSVSRVLSDLYVVDGLK